MKRIFTVLAVAALMAVLLAAMAASAFAESANCGDGDCFVGGAGTGGDKSGGKAQGGRIEGGSSSLFPNTTFTLSGDNFGDSTAGQLKFSGEVNGTVTGTERDGISRGRGTGVFGDWAGQCPFET